jgi:hypothetical protein
MKADRGSPPDAREVVEVALDHVAAWLAEGKPEANLHMAHAEGVIAGLESVDQLTSAEATEFKRRLWSLAEERAGGPVIVRGPPDPQLKIPPDRLQRVIAGPAATTLLDGQLQLLAIESYSESVVLQWRIAPVPSLAALRASAPNPDAGNLETSSALWRRLGNLPRQAGLRDDAGTAYRRLNASGHAGPGEFRQSWRFAPGLPGDATVLIATFDQVEVSVPLGGVEYQSSSP